MIFKINIFFNSSSLGENQVGKLLGKLGKILGKWEKNLGIVGKILGKVLKTTGKIGEKNGKSGKKTLQLGMKNALSNLIRARGVQSKSLGFLGGFLGLFQVFFPEFQANPAVFFSRWFLNCPC